jgi:hypothetical protein
MHGDAKVVVLFIYLTLALDLLFYIDCANVFRIRPLQMHELFGDYFPKTIRFVFTDRITPIIHTLTAKY